MTVLQGLEHDLINCRRVAGGMRCGGTAGGWRWGARGGRGGGGGRAAGCLPETSCAPSGVPVPSSYSVVSAADLLLHCGGCSSMTLPKGLEHDQINCRRMGVDKGDMLMGGGEGCRG
jgi:hypothetical protein